MGPKYCGEKMDLHSYSGVAPFYSLDSKLMLSKRRRHKRRRVNCGCCCCCCLPTTTKRPKSIFIRALLLPSAVVVIVAAICFATTTGGLVRASSDSDTSATKLSAPNRAGREAIGWKWNNEEASGDWLLVKRAEGEGGRDGEEEEGKKLSNSNRNRLNRRFSASQIVAGKQHALL